MAILWPVTDYDDFENPEARDPQSSPSHSDQHTNINDAVEAIEAKVGIDVVGALSGTIDERVTDLEGAVVGTTPVGCIMMWPTGTPPTGWLLCNGAAVDRDDYSDLHDVLKDVGGTAAYAYGAGDASTTFNIPDFRGRVGVGYHASQTQFDHLAETGGERTHILTTDELPGTTATYTFGGTDAVDPDGTGIEQAGSGTGHNNLQPYITINYIIKH